MITVGSYNSGGHNKTHDTVGRYKYFDSFHYCELIHLLDSKGKDCFKFQNLTLYRDYIEAAGDAIPLDRVPNNYGGEDRLYFECPHCGRRVRFLYFHKQRYKCRTCAKLNYRSQQTSKGWEMAVYRLDKFLKDNFNITGLAPCDTELVTPPRPKGMHERTYNKLLLDLEKLQIEQMDVFISRAGRFLGGIIARQHP